MLILGILLNVEHVILLQLKELIISIVSSGNRPCTSPGILLTRRVKAVIKNAVARRELNNFIKVYLLTFFIFDLLLDLGVATHLLVLD